MKRFTVIVATLISTLLVFLFLLPANWLAGSVNRIVMPLALTQVEGSLWNGSAHLVASQWPVDLPLRWTFSGLIKSPMKWDIWMADHKQAELSREKGTWEIRLEPAFSVPAVMLSEFTKGQGVLSGTISVSGVFNVTEGRGQGEIHFDSIGVDNPLQPLDIGNGTAQWVCKDMRVSGMCTVELKPEASLQLQGQLLWKNAHLTGQGSLQPSNGAIIQALQMMPPAMLAPVQIKPAQQGKVDQPIWNWTL